MNKFRATQLAKECGNATGERMSNSVQLDTRVLQLFSHPSVCDSKLLDTRTHTLTDTATDCDGSSARGVPPDPASKGLQGTLAGLAGPPKTPQVAQTQQASANG